MILRTAGKWLFNTRFGKKWTEAKVARFRGWLSPHTKILDIGCGSGGIACILQQEGHIITAIDVADMSYFEEVKPIVYEGEVLPFVDKSFDISLLITVLHHTSHPLTVIQEAMRVSRQIIITEDVYDSLAQQYLTYCTDTIVNMGFSTMTYQNKNDKEWRQLFASLSLELKAVHSQRVLFFFRQNTYLLQCP